MSAPIKHNDNNNADHPSFYAPPGARRALRTLPRETLQARSPATVPDGADSAFEPLAPSPTSPPAPLRAAEAPPTAPEVRVVPRDRLPDRTRTASTSHLAPGLGGPELECPLPLLQRLAKSIGVGVADAQVRSRALSASQARPFEGDVAIKALWQRLARDPEFLQGKPEPAIEPRQASPVPMLIRLFLFVVVAGLIALGVTLVSLPGALPPAFKQERSIVVSAEEFSAGMPSQMATPARLVVEGRQAFANEPLFLGIALNGLAGGEFAQLTGLVSGTRFSVGGAFGATGWRLPARDLARAFAFAPQGFIGVMDAAIDLRTGNNALIDSQAMRLEWIPKQGEAAARQPRRDRDEVKPLAAGAALDPQEIATLVRRGQDYLKTGDLAAARLVLRRAASADDAQAALALGATFDPVVHGELGVLGVPPDLAQARAWYERAAQLGSAEASRRIERIARMRP
jgi:hypothetical protein